MHTLVDFAPFRDLRGPLVLAAGFFDGVHRGHRAVLDGALNAAAAIGGEAWALTFDQHPMAVLAPNRRPPLLTPFQMRIEQLEATGIHGCLMLPFTPALAATTAEQFVDTICGRPGAVKAILCGQNWHFGARAAGTPDLLAELGRSRGFRVEAVPPVLYRGHPISSTRIRTTIQAGRIEEANEMLGRPYTIRETVVRGRGVGRTLGIATANLHPGAEVLPAVGIYAVRTRIGDRMLGGVADLGFRPTFPGARPDTPLLETHLFDFGGDLYGATLDIAFIARLRDERPFPDKETLVQQIRLDIEEARRILSEKAG